MRTLLGFVLCGLVACDPGGSYRVPGATEVMANGQEFDLAGPSSTSLRVHASWFTSSLGVGLAITNKGTSPLEIRADELHVADRKGPLEPRHYPQDGQCYRHEGEPVVTLAAGATCEIGSTFTVQVDRDRLRTLTMVHSGITRDGAPVPISVTFELE